MCLLNTSGCLIVSKTLPVVDNGITGGIPGGPVVKNPPANAGDTGLIPGPGRSHMPWSNKAPGPLLSPSATATEAQAP